jgi:hypothetical protein
VSDVLPEGESLRNAVRWISDQLRGDAERPIGPLVEAATLRFDLNPREAEYLAAFYRKARADQEAR